MNPHLLIAIDVGMTCTGVCYILKGGMPEPHMITKWPGSTATSSEKVPTVIAYQNGRPISWGFQTRLEDDNDPTIEIREWFKVALDHNEYAKYRAKDPKSVPRSHELVKHAYRDFLAYLYGYIVKTFESTNLLYGSSWRDAKIEFMFTVPTTWTALGVTNTFESLIGEAGFGRDGADHTVSVGLTEAEAAAVHTFASQSNAYVDGNIILVVDAGGGTTDLALMRAKVDGNGSRLEQLDTVKGDEIGSVEIDFAFKDLIIDRLNRVRHVLRLDDDAIEEKAQKMVNAFKPTKEDFGSDNSRRHSRKRIDVPNIASDVNLPAASIERGGMYFTNHEIESIFSVQVRKMFRLIDYQMNKMEQVAKYDQITHMVLSGGLGSSEYLYEQLRQRYLVDSPNRYAQSMVILRSHFPQAAPVRGLIQDRLQRVQRGSAILAVRKSRLSLGIVCYVRYDPQAHRQQQTMIDPVDKQEYAIDQVRWLVKKGDILKDDTIEHQFYRTVRKTESREPWITRIVKTDLADPPRNIKEFGVIPLCNMTSDLTTVPLGQFTKHKKHCWNFGKPPTYYSCAYQIKFQIQPAKVDSELWFKGQKYNQESSFRVEWDSGANVSAPKEHLISYASREDLGGYDREGAGGWH